MATITLIGNGSQFSTPAGTYPFMNCITANGTHYYYTNGDLFTANSIVAHLYRNASAVSGYETGIYIGAQNIKVASSTDTTNLNYTYAVNSVDSVEVDFIDKYTLGGYTYQDIHIYPYPNMTLLKNSQVLDNMQVKTGELFTSTELPTLPDEGGYVFEGWYYDSNFTNKANVGDVITSQINFSLYAHFIPRPPFDFSTVKAISIPEGSVTQITDSNGVILWQLTLSKRYRQLEYIQNDTTATNNRIPLDISWASTSTTNLDISFSLTQTTGQYYGSILSGSPNSHLAYVNGSSSSSNLRVRWRGGTWLNLGSLTTIGTSKHTIGLWNGRFWLDDNSVGTSSSNTTAVTDLTLFSQTPDGTQFNLLGKFYEMILKSNDVEVHHYLPVQRKDDGMIGVYDTITNVFKTTAGTNTLVAGPVTDENPSWSPEIGSYHTVWSGSYEKLLDGNDVYPTGSSSTSTVTIQSNIDATIKNAIVPGRTTRIYFEPISTSSTAYQTVSGQWISGSSTTYYAANYYGCSRINQMTYVELDIPEPTGAFKSGYSDYFIRNVNKNNLQARFFWTISSSNVFNLNIYLGVFRCDGAGESSSSSATRSKCYSAACKITKVEQYY
jgi:uncharacterized repeat protein (TIGR02543 family)